MSGGGASLVEVGGLAWCLGVAGRAWEWLGVPGVAGSGLGGSVKHSTVAGLALLGSKCWWLPWLENGGLAWGKKRDNGAFWKGCRAARASGNGGWEWVGGVGGWRGG